MWKLNTCVLIVFCIFIHMTVYADVVSYEDFLKKLTNSNSNVKIANIVKVGCRQGFKFIYGKCRQVFWNLKVNYT